MRDKKELTKYVASFVLGDGALFSLKRYNNVEERKVERPQYDRPKNSHYYLKQVADHRDYVNWQTEILSDITSVRQSYQDGYVDNRGYSIKSQIILTTAAHPFYTNLRERLYLDNRRVISPHDLKLFDAETLACLYMDNGWLEAEHRTTTGVYVRVGLGTHAYSYGDNLLLRDFILGLIGCEFNIQRHRQKSGEYKFYLRAKKDHAKRFVDTIARYVLPSFEYKIDYSRTVSPIHNMGGDIV